MARIEVNLWSGLRRLADGQQVVTVEATTVGEMLDALVAAHPALGPLLQAGVSVAIDGEITNGRHLPVTPENEVFLMQRLKGG
ncbi:MoaD/ThiS family protein [Tropicibacter oceani]|uniref:MoaD/ThiS family protein n=1 Tax=Tropicibacter oceani TaxID=3058420 RepID=A0ABY8QMT4_9RHOB|nr:MoaD/ThiS family protein [Tropicibacter oceani]WGW05417.1 MoaD/ThiS family protein [Tropicibacter oceani]